MPLADAIFDYLTNNEFRSATKYQPTFISLPASVYSVETTFSPPRSPSVYSAETVFDPHWEVDTSMFPSMRIFHFPWLMLFCLSLK